MYAVEFEAPIENGIVPQNNNLTDKITKIIFISDTLSVLSDTLSQSICTATGLGCFNSLSIQLHSI